MPQHLIKRVGADPAALFTIGYVRMHLRESLVNTDNDTYILDLVKAMYEHVEDQIARSLITRSWSVSMAAFPSELKLHVSPLVSVTEVAYYDAANDAQVMDSGDYWVDSTKEPGKVLERYGWPSTFNRPDAVTVEFTAGYGTAADVPLPLKQYILLGVGDMYNNREATNIGNITTRLKFAEYLLNPYLTTEV